MDHAYTDDVFGIVDSVEFSEMVRITNLYAMPTDTLLSVDEMVGITNLYSSVSIDSSSIVAETIEAPTPDNHSLSVADMIAITELYAGSDRWSAGAACHGDTSVVVLPGVVAAIPPRPKSRKRAADTNDSLCHDVHEDIKKSDGVRFSLDPNYKQAVHGDTWSRILGSRCNPRLSKMLADTCSAISDMGEIPISTVEHENSQLAIGRTYPDGTRMPDCSYGANCSAFDLTLCKSALHPYLTPAQEVSSAVVHGPCLLCIRRLVTALVSASGSKAIVATDIAIPVRFINTVNQPGGYHLHVRFLCVSFIFPRVFFCCFFVICFDKIL